jgi:hypothetical protein
MTMVDTDALEKEITGQPAKVLSEDEEKEQVLSCLVSVNRFAAVLGGNESFTSNGIGIGEWAALAALRRGPLSSAALSRKLSVSRQRSKQLIDGLVSTGLVAVHAGEGQKKAMQINDAGTAALNRVADSLYQTAKQATGGNMRQFRRLRKQLRVLERGFSGKPADDGEPRGKRRKAARADDGDDD